MNPPAIGSVYESSALPAGRSGQIIFLGTEDRKGNIVYSFRRLHLYYEGETFSMRPDEFEKSQWSLVHCQTYFL